MYQTNQSSNYYQSPVIPNPPVANVHASNYSPYYQQYYNQYYNPYYNYGYPQYGTYPCSQCPQSAYQQPYYSNSSQYGSNCHCYDCAQYGLSINRDRITPKFPEKLPYSFVTSGDRVEDKLVINEPTNESAPFQTQRRKSYVPYTRKYIEYQDYIQYTPVQRSEWQYQKVMKQIDYVPQEYYESSVEYIPQEKLSHKVQYLPVEQQVIHVPEDNLRPKAEISAINLTKGIATTGTTFPRFSAREVSQIRETRMLPAGKSIIKINGGQPPMNAIPINLVSTQNYRRVIVEPPQQQNVANNEKYSSSIRPAESSVEMVPRSRLNPVQEIMPKIIEQQEVNQNSYRFPQTGGVMIGSSSNEQAEQQYGQNYESEFNSIERNRIRGSEVLTSVLHDLPEKPEQANNPNFDFRESGKVFSEEFNFDRREYEKKESIFNKFEEDQENY